MWVMLPIVFFPYFTIVVHVTIFHVDIHRIV